MNKTINTSKAAKPRLELTCCAAVNAPPKAKSGAFQAASAAKTPSPLNKPLGG